ncbi:hypothetical protein HOY80DRAFT_1061588 [Tuber brumale]|nr:hypothetical protein HOY80DRAFT_1061588 [Tuber brumale]
MLEKSLALESENSRPWYHFSVLSRRLHEALVELKPQGKFVAAFCPFCGCNYNQVDYSDWLERMEREDRGAKRVEFRGRVDVELLVVEEEMVVEAKKKVVVRLPVAVAGSVAGVGVAVDVVMVEVAGKGKEVVEVAQEREYSMQSREEDWIVVRKTVRERGVDRKSRVIEEERDVVRKRINLQPPGKVLLDKAQFGLKRAWVVRKEGVDRVGGLAAPVALVGAPCGPVVYRDMDLGSKQLRGRGVGELVPKRLRDIGRFRGAGYGRFWFMLVFIFMLEGMRLQV